MESPTRRHPDPNVPDPFVAYYEKKSVSSDTLERFERIIDLMLRVRRSLGLPVDGLSVADVGCNAGTQCFLWARRGHRVHGLDINASLLEIAARRGKDMGLDVDFRAGTATELPWESSTMDVLLMPELLEHVADWRPCLTEAARVLRPGGVLFVSTTNRLCPRQMEFELPAYSWYPSWLKRRYERLAVTTRPELVNHATYPAVHWFSPYELISTLDGLGLKGSDHFDWIDLDRKSAPAALVVRLIRALPPLRWLAHVATPYSMVIAAKR